MLLLAVAGAAVVVLVTAVLLVRRAGPDPVERFHRARAMTTAWSQQAAGADVAVAAARAPEREAAREPEQVG